MVWGGAPGQSCWALEMKSWPHSSQGLSFNCAVSPKGKKNWTFQTNFLCLLLGDPPLATRALGVVYSVFRFSDGVCGGSLWEPLGVTLPAGSTTFPLKLLPDHQNWHFLMFLNDDINHLLFSFALSETFGEAF